MKDLIIQALNGLYSKLENELPQTKLQEKTIRIMDVSPLELVKFMKDNNVPDDAEFAGVNNSYDAYDDFVLSWYVPIPTTDKDKLLYMKDKFNFRASKYIWDIMKLNGFERGSFDGTRLRDFKDTTFYDMYINKEFDRIASYCTMFNFRKI